MKIAVISDTHLGDPACRLVTKEEPVQLTPTYIDFRDAVRKFTGGAPLDYLVLNGDILDFSISSFEDACRKARPFFQGIVDDQLAAELIYIPGNHDKHVWDAVEWETRIILKMRKGELPEAFRRTQPGALDMDGSIDLPGVSKNPETGQYGGLFLEGMIPKDKAIPICLVYPNLYIKSASGCWLVTHGHMLEPAWVLLSELLSGEPELRGPVGLKELEEYNIPVTSMICTGVGQAGKVSRLFYQVAQQAKKGKSDRLRKLLDNMLPRVDDLIDLPWALEWADNAFLSMIKKMAVSMAESTSDARYNTEYYEHKAVRSRFHRFYAATCVQASELQLPAPQQIIFGHTHQSITPENPMKSDPLAPLGGKIANLYNTGGWLKGEGVDAKAQILFLDERGTLTGQLI